MTPKKDDLMSGLARLKIAAAVLAVTLGLPGLGLANEFTVSPT
jgi:hypothetical protein